VGARWYRASQGSAAISNNVRRNSGWAKNNLFLRHLALPRGYVNFAPAPGEGNSNNCSFSLWIGELSRTPVYPRNRIAMAQGKTSGESATVGPGLDKLAPRIMHRAASFSVELEP